MSVRIATWLCVSTLVVAGEAASDEKTVLPDPVRATLERAAQDVVRERGRYDTAVRKVTDKLVVDLKKEVERTTKAGNLVMAKAIQEQLESVTRGDFVTEAEDRVAGTDLLGDGRLLRVERCALPLGGTFTREKSDVTLRGPGTGDVQNSVAVIPQAIPVGGSVRGTVTAHDKWCGFAIAATEKGDMYHSFYGEPGGSCSLFAHTGATRTRLGIGSIAVAIPIGQTVRFHITHSAAKSWEVTVGGASHRFDVVTGGDCWGLTSYAGGSITMRIE